jgi:serine/threonine-protein kinase BUR1
LYLALAGTPTPENWPEHDQLPWFGLFKPPKFIDRTLTQHLRCTDQNAIDVLEKLLQFNPSTRLSAERALEHEYFWTSPLPQAELRPDPIMGEGQSCHEFEAKAAQKQERGEKRREDGEPAQAKRPRPANVGSGTPHPSLSPVSIPLKEPKQRPFVLVPPTYPNMPADTAAVHPQVAPLWTSMASCCVGRVATCRRSTATRPVARARCQSSSVDHPNG